MKKTPHVHAEWIKAKADGETVQELKKLSTTWVDMADDDWSFTDARMYRIKPAAPETRMTDDDFRSLPGLSMLVDSAFTHARIIANTAIARALADGDVVLPNDR